MVSSKGVLAWSRAFPPLPSGTSHQAPQVVEAPMPDQHGSTKLSVGDVTPEVTQAP